MLNDVAPLPTAQVPAEQAAPTGFAGTPVDSFKDAFGMVLGVGSDVTLAGEFESLMPEASFGNVRTVELREGPDGDYHRVGVLWYGVGGLFVRHYVGHQLLKATLVNQESKNRWEKNDKVPAVTEGETPLPSLAGEEQDAAEESILPVVKLIFEEQGGVGGDVQVIIAKCIERLGADSEQLIRDVLIDLRFEAGGVQ